MTKRKTNKEADASSSTQKPTKDPPITHPESRSSTANLNSKIDKHKSTLQHAAPKESTMPDPPTTPLNPESQQHTQPKAPGLPKAPVSTFKTSTPSTRPMTSNANVITSPPSTNPPPAPINSNDTLPALTTTHPNNIQNQTQDYITSLKLSTKDMEAETLRLREILAAKKVELAAKKTEMMGRVKGNGFGRRWREVRRAKGAGGGAGSGVV